MAIKCTGRRMSGGNEHEHISHLRWVQDGTGSQGINTIAEMIAYVDKQGNQSVYCTDKYGGSLAYVQIATHGSLRYLRTVADNRWTNNLLELPLV